MPDDDLQELLQPLPPVLDDVVAESVREDLARQRGDGDARALALEDITEVLEVTVPPAHGAVLQLEGGDVGPADDLVVGVHLARGAVRLRVFDLQVGRRYEKGRFLKRRGRCSCGKKEGLLACSLTSISRMFSGTP